MAHSQIQLLLAVEEALNPCWPSHSQTLSAQLHQERWPRLSFGSSDRLVKGFALLDAELVVSLATLPPVPGQQSPQ